MVTVVAPLTVAPAAGAAKAADSGVGAGDGAGDDVVPLATTIATPPVPVLPAASRAAAVSVCVPSAASVVSYGSEIGPAVALVALPTVRPPSVSVIVFDVPVTPVSQTTAHAVPFTVVPAVGCVIATLSVPVGAGGGAAALATVTDSDAVAERPSESVTVAVSVWTAFVSPLVFHAYETPVPL